MPRPHDYPSPISGGPAPLGMEEQSRSGGKGVFVTVGSTQFDELIRAATTQQFCQVGENFFGLFPSWWSS